MQEKSTVYCRICGVMNYISTNNLFRLLVSLISVLVTVERYVFYVLDTDEDGLRESKMIVMM